MALEHALLVALSEKPGAGLELARRFERSLGFFWHATHQQIYRVLSRMESDGWLSVETVPQTGKPDTRVYTVSTAGAQVLADWLAEPTQMETFRSDLAVKLRGASYGDRPTLLRHVRETLADHEARLAHYRVLEQRDYPEPAALDGHALDQLLVLRGGIRLEEFWIGWLSDYLHAHGFVTGARAPSSTSDNSKDTR
ncbi:PadR family transcriptional regulator [Nocardioides piscis]|uniref:PadR family transcriptional regulator n=1 Tax=Nocardioides piscis TaxID=2714938 RepID=A0A6G7YE04_9ACTN|nr:PadR family transcriptional regulator [Nocardioides piscis]QIK75000.1 PadR family transcriptional regulator [Nocardioides piscis]